jgi:hypothetical protein
MQAALFVEAYSAKAITVPTKGNMPKKKPKKRKKITFKARLEKLGYKSYNSYLISEHWTEFRASYYSEHPKECYVCGCSENIHLHHIRYTRIGKEKVSDVVPLCKKHHKRVHRMVRKGSPLVSAHKELKKDIEKKALSKKRPRKSQ